MCARNAYGIYVTNSEKFINIFTKAHRENKIFKQIKFKIMVKKTTTASLKKYLLKRLKKISIYNQ
jgi:hypothetical protein